MPRLRRVDCAGPGIVRRRRGRGFSYHWPDGRSVTEPDVLARIRALVLPPAWTDVWICPLPNGHIQAIGTDAAGRRQYRYHDAWREQRDRAKHDRILQFARRLADARRVVEQHLALPGYPRERVLAAAFRMLDLGFFRVGGEAYADEYGSYGLATIRRDHVTIRSGAVVFDYPSKSGKQRVQQLVDDDLHAVVRGLLRRKDDQPELLAYRTGRGWRDVRSEDINDYLREVIGVEASAKDFRTWHATVLMAAVLARQSPPPGSQTARNKAVRAGYVEVSEALGNTPAVCKASYVDPRVVDLFHDGTVISLPPRKRSDDAMRSALEKEVLDLLHTDPED
jgi:DNA topoisomerase I